jgi:ring-1,2-phenylacetyl-CoA epoxidase subunit PaaA/ring-1,2-phenylacetyl-CoA epoxidase subunit PaaC
VHAEAWAKRLSRSGVQQRQRLLSALTDTWAQAGRWLGPADDPGVAAAVALGMVSSDARTQRALVREWLSALLQGEGISLELDEPTDFSRWDAERRRWDPRP